MHEKLLQNAGLTQREVTLYTTLLRHGELMASELAKKTDMIRTNTYDVLRTLIAKGIVSHVIRSGKKYFRATDAEKLLDYIDTQKKDLDETREKIDAILPQLEPLDHDGTRPSIEVYEGREGMKTILAMSVRESLKTGKEILGISVQQQKCRDLAGPYHVRWYEDRARHKIQSRYLMAAEEEIIPIKHTEFKRLPESAKKPNEIFIFGDITTQFFFTGDLFTAIVIKNEEITDKYRDYFQFLWELVE